MKKSKTPPGYNKMTCNIVLMAIGYVLLASAIIAATLHTVRYFIID